MITFLKSGGPMMWPLIIIAIVILGLVVKKVIEFNRSDKLKSGYPESGINAIIFWGGIALVLGFFAHFYGVYMAMNAIVRASDISPAIVAMGYTMSLTSIIFALLIFLFSAIAWFVLRWRFKKLAGNTAK